MAFTRVWSDTTPADIDAALTLGVAIRNLRVDLRERINALIGVPEATALADPLTSIFDAGTSGTTKTIDWANGPVQRVSMTGNCTFTFTNPIAGRPHVLIMVQDATGGRTFTATAYDFGGTAFAPDTAANRINVVTALWDGTQYLAGAFVTGAT